jgi:hypothetical protein
MALFARTPHSTPLQGGSTFNSNRGHSSYNFNRGRYSRGRDKDRASSSDKPQCQICLKWGHHASH